MSPRIYSYISSLHGACNSSHLFLSTCYTDGPSMPLNLTLPSSTILVWSPSWARLKPPPSKSFPVHGHSAVLKSGVAQLFQGYEQELFTSVEWTFLPSSGQLALASSSERIQRKRQRCNAVFGWRKLVWEVNHCEGKRKEERKKEKEREGGMPASVIYKYARKVKVMLKLMFSKLVYVRRAVFQR